MLDDLVGNITRSLKEMGLYNNTIIVFSSDNGQASFAEVGNFPLKGNSF